MLVNKIVLIGDKDNGKSTTIGNLLILTKSISDARLNEAKKISMQLGRKFEPGFLLDSFFEERKNAMTIDTTRAELMYKNTAFEFIDVPGHKTLIKNMISGASYANVALLIVSAKKGEGVKAQTKRHVFITNMLGINKLIVAVNKMDTVDYSQEAFEAVKSKLGKFFEKTSMQNSNVVFIPISAYDQENLIKKSDKMKWYKGRPLLEELYQQVKQKTSAGKSINGAIVLLQGTINKGGNKLIIGKVLNGIVKANSTMMQIPDRKKVKIRMLFVKGVCVKEAVKGENIAAEAIGGISGEPKGKILTDTSGVEVVKTGKEIKVRLLFAEKPYTKSMMMNFNNKSIACKLSHVQQVIDPATGNELSKLKALCVVDSVLKLNEYIAYTEFSKLKELGEFALYSKNKFIGFGNIVE